MRNSNLHKAKKAKNDEFYTQISDIENEIRHYKDQFRGKHVFLNCDDPEKSNFWKFFELNFEHYGLKKLTVTHYEDSKPSYKLELTGDTNGDGRIDNKDIVKTPLKQNGDFRSDESIEILKECDIVVTNPPFSLFREYIAQLMEHDKKFLIVGSMNAITYKEIFSLIKDERLWLGINNIKEFIQPNGEIKKFGNINWFTNIEHSRRNESLILTEKYTEEKYFKYDNYDAINVDKVNEIPKDYYGPIGVPISYLGKHNPNDFEILGAMTTTKKNKR